MSQLHHFGRHTQTVLWDIFEFISKICIQHISFFCCAPFRSLSSRLLHLAFSYRTCSHFHNVTPRRYDALRWYNQNTRHLLSIFGTSMVRLFDLSDVSLPDGRDLGHSIAFSYGMTLQSAPFLQYWFSLHFLWLASQSHTFTHADTSLLVHNINPATQGRSKHTSLVYMPHFDTSRW
jgi:hypothetical protein